MDGTMTRQDGDAAAAASDAASDSGETIDLARIMHDIPHRYPFLFLDRVEELKRGRSAIGVKNFTINEEVFQGHFRGHPVVPAVIIIEVMAQTAAVLVVETLGDEVANRVVYFMSIDSAKFRKPVGPGDQLRVHVSKLKNRGKYIWKFVASARVDGVEMASATYTAMIMGDTAN
jgi:3-hydroxyacyl-[acyl-carrier-protein] dehydratase